MGKHLIRVRIFEGSISISHGWGRDYFVVGGDVRVRCNGMESCNPGNGHDEIETQFLAEYAFAKVGGKAAHAIDIRWFELIKVNRDFLFSFVLFFMGQGASQFGEWIIRN